MSLATVQECQQLPPASFDSLLGRQEAHIVCTTSTAAGPRKGRKEGQAIRRRDAEGMQSEAAVVRSLRGHCQASSVGGEDDKQPNISHRQQPAAATWLGPVILASPFSLVLMSHQPSPALRGGQGLFGRGTARGAEVRPHSQAEPSLPDL